MHTEVCGMTGRQGPAAEHRELHAAQRSVSICGGKNLEEMDVCTCITEWMCIHVLTESSCCTAEIITTSIIISQ